MAANERAALHRAHGHKLDRIIPQLYMHVILVPPGKTPEEVIAHYENHPLVEFAEVEIFREPAVTPNDPAFVNWQRPLQRLSAEAAWDITTGSPNVPIAALDTGLDYNHYDFAGRIILGYDFADGDSDFYDPHGHGTWVTGIFGATANNGLGIAGGTWQNPIMVLRTAFGLDTVEAITWAADNGARVITMSFSGFTPTQWEANVMQYAFDRHVVLVSSAGNNGTDQPTYPAAYPTVLAVTGVNSYGDPVGYNWGDWIDLSAPAGTLTTYHTAFDEDGLGQAGGTSISAPFVAAAAGLVFSVNPNLTSTQVMDILRSTADDVGDPGFDVMTGYGRVNFHAAVLAASGIEPDPDTTPPTASVVSPTAGDVLSDTVTVIVEAADDTRVTYVDLHVDDTFLGSDTVSPHEWVVDTTQWPDGQHAVWAVAHDMAENTGVSDPVFVTFDNSAPCDCPPDCSVPPASEQPGLTCADGLDNDCDGVMDCDDPDCDTDVTCVVTGCDNDALCDAGEDCNNCPGDCVAASGASCGNGVCEAGDGEDCVTCPADCNGKQNGKVSNRFCCGGGGGINPVGCTDARCTKESFACTDGAAGASCCGDGVCNGVESGCNCAVDCGPAESNESVGSTCRDGLDNDCDGQADCDDPDCDADVTCAVTSCDNDGVCDAGEDCNTCAADCAGRVRGRRTDRFCCGNGVLEVPEGDGTVCDGNP